MLVCFSALKLLRVQCHLFLKNSTKLLNSALDDILGDFLIIFFTPNAILEGIKILLNLDAFEQNLHPISRKQNVNFLHTFIAYVAAKTYFKYSSHWDTMHLVEYAMLH